MLNIEPSQSREMAGLIFALHYALLDHFEVTRLIHLLGGLLEPRGTLTGAGTAKLLARQLPPPLPPTLDPALPYDKLIHPDNSDY